MKTIFTALFLTLSVAHAQVGRNTAEYNLRGDQGLQGFDPVAVFTEGGGTARAGANDINVAHLGVMYNFATEANKNRFVANPAKYEPTYGGWCAFAMASGSKVPIQTNIFTISGQRAHYFVSNSAKRAWDRDPRGFEARADANWLRISGESPRN